ncbi:hypothetical protein N7537_010991 [Penicillium hordei]|uniref:Uncharacterized protein n=1 Tax=Penicillium hordei TaxID=40994 RepID=A0AAD6GSC4_9EURO|nr:uncharacterized protein N7537_010991 [Penicillium hordei]KAJ5588313.1 hypothetical protein N7537_010991 [Penicillium hordei]
MSDLLEGHIVRTFSRLKLLKVEAEKIMEWFEQNDDGNQWTVVLGLRGLTIKNLAYRFQWKGSMELIKVVPSGSYEAAADRFVDVVKSKLRAMGIPFEELLWGD